MNAVFADAAYWVAMANPRDQWHRAAKRARDELGDVKLVTTDEALMEFLTGLSRYGPVLRSRAASTARAIMSSRDVKVLHQTRDSFVAGLDRYRRRLDKDYSLQDCIAFNAMDAEGITRALTPDRHFEQEGFVVLMSSHTE